MALDAWDQVLGRPRCEQQRRSGSIIGRAGAPAWLLVVDPRGRSPAALDPRAGATAMEATAMEAGARWRRGGDGGTRDGSSSVVFLALPRCPPWLNDLLVGVDRVVGLSAGKASGSGEKQAAGSAPSSVETGLL